MALTENIKHARVNVVTGETDHVYYDEAEWAQVEADRAAAVLPKAKDAATAAIKAQAQAEVDAIIQPPQLNQGLARMNELLMIRIMAGSWTPAEQAEVDGYQAVLNTTRAFRVREVVALAAVDAAVAVPEVEAVIL